MCGRYTLTRPDALRIFGGEGPLIDDRRLPIDFNLSASSGLRSTPRADPHSTPRAPTARFNAAPGQDLPILRAERDPQGRQRIRCRMARWGVRGPGGPGQEGSRWLINLRAATADSGWSQRAFVQGRCLVPADGFYEWSGPATARRAWYLRPADHGLVFFAGVAVRAPRSPSGWAFLILTVPAGPDHPVRHGRAPALLAIEAAARWLDRRPPAAVTRRMLRPAPRHFWQATEVSPAVGDWRRDHPALIEPLRRQQLSLAL